MRSQIIGHFSSDHEDLMLVIDKVQLVRDGKIEVYKVSFTGRVGLDVRKKVSFWSRLADLFRKRKWIPLLVQNTVSGKAEQVYINAHNISHHLAWKIQQQNIHYVGHEFHKDNKNSPCRFVQMILESTPSKAAL